MDCDQTPLRNFETPSAPRKARVQIERPPEDAEVRRVLFDDESSDESVDDYPKRPRSPVFIIGDARPVRQRIWIPNDNSVTNAIRK
ncbi:hypothetical protein Indivirus_1_217 [Indivirus ILV1]|uniref:Uncharacterized protein n=1 Tax=Indivirus ILV1 TaxID=1977633 RepID=A0A1V0SD87_9VIRU|nr:hypothetical protein Indivirus_1_217 [Indivirus ILV1]